MKNKFLIIMFVIIVAIPIHYNSISAEIENVSAVSEDFTLDRSFIVDIILFDYINDTDLVNGMIAKLPNSINVALGITYTYQITYNVIYPETSLVDTLNSFIDSIADTEAITSKMDNVALARQASEWNVENIFLDQSGTAINAVQTEEWLWNNIQPILSENSAYQIVVMNFTRFDSELNKHWFELPEIDTASGQQRTWWRLEWDLPPTSTVNNYNAKFPYSGWSSNYSMYFLDPTSHNWYFDWVRIWRGDVPDVDGNQHYYYTLNEYIEHLGGFSESTDTQIGNYIGNWMREIVENLFFYQPIGTVRSPDKLVVQVAIFTDDTSINPYPDVTWTVNETFVGEKLGELIPKAIMDVQIDFYRLEDHPNVQATLEDSHLSNPFGTEDPPIPNYEYYDGYTLINDMQGHNTEFFPTVTGVNNVYVRGYVFLLDNCSFASPGLWAGGGLYTGLGGGGRIVIMNEIDRIFFNRTTDPVKKDSISGVFVHEVGHAVGMPHPFTSGNYASDFINDVMGYYPSSPSYSNLFIRGFNRYITEKKMDDLVADLEMLSRSTATKYVEEVQILFNSIVTDYLTLEYTFIDQKIEQLYYWIEKINNLKTENPINAPAIIESNVSVSGTIISGSWTVMDSNPHKYYIYINSSLINSSEFQSGIPITFSKGGYATGNYYNVSILLYDAFGKVTVQSNYVFEKITTTDTSVTDITNTTTSGTTTTSDGTSSPSFTILLLLSVLSSIAGVRFKRKKN